MLKEKMLNALNEQINAEQYSSLLYLSMSSWFQDKGLPGFANWMYIQYQEEMTHANKLFTYVVDRGEKPVLKAIDQVPVEWEGIIEIYEATLQHEQHVTALIDNLVDVAIEVKDHATQSFLQWFVDEQVEEEAIVDAVIQDLKRVGDFGPGLFLLDRELGTVTPAAADTQA